MKIGSTVLRGVAVLRLNDSPANTYSYEMMRELDAAIVDARMNRDVHVIVLIGAGEKFFCSGLEAGFSEGLAMEREMQQLLFESSDAKEGIAANLEKRKAQFTGK